MPRNRAKITLRRLALSSLLVASATTAQQPSPFAENVRSSPAFAPDQQQKAFHLPEGFEVSLFAAEPDIGKPMNMAFDAKGRLWITESTEYPFPKKPGDTGRDKIRVLEDTDNDGRADKVVTFADGLNIPIGLYPYKAGVIAFSIPAISFFQDTDGDGKSDKIDVLYSGFGSRDTHGMTNSFRRGFDGWLYATHGFNNESHIKSSDGASSISLTSGNVYRMGVDGKQVQQIAWGPVNPFGATFDSLGNFFISDCHSWPLINVLRNAWYPQFGRPHNGLGFAPQMMSHSHSSTALDGACWYESPQFPKEFQGNLFVGNVMTCRVNRDVLEDRGSTRVAVEQPDFLTCDDPWFRPVDIQLGPDGALYVADFYNRIIGHYEVPLDHPGRDRQRGRIWRITRRGAEHRRIDLSTAPAEKLVAALADANIKVRFLAADELHDRIGTSAAPELKNAVSNSANGNQMAHALWLLQRLGALDEQMVSAAARHADRTVRTHALRMLSEMKGLSASHRSMMLEGLKDSDAFVRRAAADALATHPSTENVKPLLALVHETAAQDTHLIHTARIAIHAAMNRDKVWNQIASFPLDAKDRRVLAGIALACPREDAARFLLAALLENNTEPRDLSPNVMHVFRHLPALTDAEHDALKKVLDLNINRQIVALKAAADAYGQKKAAPSARIVEWAQQLLPAAMSSTAADARQRSTRVRDVLEVARLLNVTGSAQVVKPALTDPALDAVARGAAARALLRWDSATHASDVAAVLNDARETVPVRETMAQALAETGSAGARATLLSALPPASQAAQVKIAQALASNAEGSELLMGAIEKGMVTARLLMEPPVVQRLEQAKVKDLQARITTLTKGISAPADDLQKLIDQRRTSFRPDQSSTEAGALVFSKSCIVCHALDGQGGAIAPQLDGIGARGLDRIVEDILDPSRNVDPAFYLSSLTLKNGDFVDGLFRREEGELLVFANSQGQEVKVPKSQIQRRVEFKRSAMPDNFHEVLTPEEFHHLIAFLLSKTTKQP